MKQTNLKIAFLLLAINLAACSSAKKNEDATLAKQTQTQAPADTPDQIMERAALAFSNAEGLTPEQKTKLSAIYTRVYTESKKIRRDMGQSKSLLFMTLAKVDYKEKEIAQLKKQIIALDQKRLAIMFTALDDVQNVVGKGIEAEKIYKHFEYYENPNHQIMRDNIF
ncbi:MAG: hypothetical protein WA160_03945 [Pseudobdellovibrio sp.]